MKVIREKTEKPIGIEFTFEEANLIKKFLGQTTVGHTSKILRVNETDQKVISTDKALYDLFQLLDDEITKQARMIL